MTITLITGGNRGLGHEIARRLVQAGQTVWIGARDAENGRKAADRLGADFVQLDVTDDASVDAAVKTLRARVGHLDILINNAGILGEVTAPRGHGSRPDPPRLRNQRLRTGARHARVPAPAAESDRPVRRQRHPAASARSR